MNMFQTLCVRFVERVEHLGLKGQKREAECLAFFVGAATALQAIEHPEAEHVTGCTHLIIASRGYMEVARVAKEAREKAAA